MTTESWGRVFLKTVGLVALSTGLGLVHNYVVSPHGIRLSESPLQAVSGLDPAWFIGLEEARNKWSRGVRFVDARAEAFFRYEGHIRGALSLPYETFAETFPLIEGELPEKDEEIVCYCSGFGCEESAELAELLRARGYARVFVYEGGWPEWSQAGLPVDAPEPSAQ